MKTHMAFSFAEQEKKKSKDYISHFLSRPHDLRNADVTALRKSREKKKETTKLVTLAKQTQ